ncbi:hypothetical protein NFI96_033933 [Prochilodus magdalenae]|nr:hypothetical protein NFI96_033933 [Prochilodus magdalenae]
MFFREALAPFMKHEAEGHFSEDTTPLVPFQYVLCAATSPAAKLQDETLTYLNQGQSYEIRMLNRKLVECTHISNKYVKVGQRALYVWCFMTGVCSTPSGSSWRDGGGILDVDIALSVGITEPRVHPLQLNTIEFLWDPTKNASVFIQVVNCISTEFTLRKHGGEKGVPFRIQVDTFVQNEQGEYLEHVHSSSCQVKVFKPKGADRKLKTDRDKIEKKSLQDRDKYQPSYETTILTECSPWPDSPSINNMSNGPSAVCHSSTISYSFTDGCIQPRLTMYVSQQKNKSQPYSKPGDDEVYHALYLEDLTLLELTEKIANLYSVPARQICHVYRQGPTGIHILVSDEVRQPRSSCSKRVG